MLYLVRYMVHYMVHDVVHDMVQCIGSSLLKTVACRALVRGALPRAWSAAWSRLRVTGHRTWRAPRPVRQIFRLMWTRSIATQSVAHYLSARRDLADTPRPAGAPR